MVRFGDLVGDKKEFADMMFQFQYGAIWSFLKNVPPESGTVVSIPVWCDLENFGKSKFIPIPRFQFQYGAIWSWLNAIKQSG